MILAILLSLIFVCGLPTPSAALDSNNVPVDSLSLYPTNPFSTTPIAGRQPYGRIQVDGSVGFYLNDYFIAGTASHALAYASSVGKAIFPMMEQDIRGISIQTLQHLSLNKAIVRTLENASSGTFYLPHQLHTRGTATLMTSSVPTATQALAQAVSPTNRQRICWERRPEYFQQYGNGLHIKTTASPAEGPSPNPDSRIFPLPDDFCR